MSGQFHGDAPPDALASLQRIYGFLLSHPNGNQIMQEWNVVHQGLATVRDYHQVVSQLTSLACQLVDEPAGNSRVSMVTRLQDLVEKLQNVSPRL